MWRIGIAIVTLIVGAATASCGDSGGSSGSGQTPEPVVARSPATAFAPLVRIDGRERAFPMSAAHFIAQSGLEWEGGACSLERDVTASATSRAAASQPIPLLDPVRLGHEPAYRVRDAGPGCAHRNVYSTVQRTRAFDTEDRPAGLQPEEAFNLDILTDAQPGRLRTGPDGQLVGVPVYYAIEGEGGAGATADLRISYWIAFGREHVPGPAPGSPGDHEGDWERIDVLLESARGRHAYVPRAVEYRQRRGTLRVPWDEAERAGPGASHPVVQLDPGIHTPRPPGDCDDCVDWRTWQLLRDVRREPWWGYGGGWGEVGSNDETSGPLGPSPFEIGTLPLYPAGDGLLDNPTYGKGSEDGSVSTP